MLFTFTEKETAVVNKFISSSNKLDSSSKELFALGFKLYRQYKDNKPNEIKKALKENISCITNDTLRNRTMKVFKLAETYTRVKAFSNFGMLHFYNIENMIKLFEFIENNEDKCKIKLELAKKMVYDCYKKDIQKVEYNNSVAKIITEIKQANGIQNVEDNFKFSDYKQLVLKGLNNISSLEDLEEIEALIKARKEELTTEEDSITEEEEEAVA